MLPMAATTNHEGTSAMSIEWTYKRAGLYRLDIDGCTYTVIDGRGAGWTVNKHWDGVHLWTLPVNSLRAARELISTEVAA